LTAASSQVPGIRASFDESGSAIRAAWVDEVRTKFQREAFGVKFGGVFSGAEDF